MEAKNAAKSSRAGSQAAAKDTSTGPSEEDIERMQQEKAAAALGSLATQAGPMPGATTAAVTVNLDGDDEAKEDLLKLAVEAGGDGNASGEGDFSAQAAPKYALNTQTKFELEGFEKAKADQRARLVSGTTQVAGGWEFKGQSFISKPAELLFKDFEVGQQYTKVFTMTNVSYTFNSFKILDLADEYVDFFKITFEKPGRMSAGVSCPMTISFKPELNEDIFTSINFYTETGPVSVPVRCLIKDAPQNNQSRH